MSDIVEVCVCVCVCFSMPGIVFKVLGRCACVCVRARVCQTSLWLSRAEVVCLRECSMSEVVQRVCSLAWIW